MLISNTLKNLRQRRFADMSYMENVFEKTKTREDFFPWHLVSNPCALLTLYIWGIGVRIASMGVKKIRDVVTNLSYIRNSAHIHGKIKGLLNCARG